MSRSVSVPSNAAQVVYAIMGECSGYDEFESVVDDLRDVGIRRFPSMTRCDKWLGREDRAVLENDRAYFTVSEYNGLVAVAAVPKDETNGLAVTWARRVKLKELASCFGEIVRSMGTFSNGEQMFSPIAKPTKGLMGLGWSSKEGWL